MYESANVKKFHDCKNALTSECPHENNPAMKRIKGDKDTWAIKPGKPVDNLTYGDDEMAASLCENCEAFEISNTATA